MGFTDPRFAIIAEWETAQEELRHAKEIEAKARQAMIAVCYPMHQPGAELEGTHNIPLANGYKLKGVFGTNYTVNNNTLPDVCTALSAMGEAGEHALDGLFRYKPELNVTTYKLLMPSLKAIVDRTVTTKPALPTFEIVEAKAKDK